jgi:hypothetical protein
MDRRARFAASDPNGGNQYAIDGHLQTDDVGIVWLQDLSQQNVSNVVASLEANADAMEANVLPSGTVFSANITSGSELAAIFGDPTSASSGGAIAPPAHDDARVESLPESRLQCPSARGDCDRDPSNGCQTDGRCAHLQ